MFRTFPLVGTQFHWPKYQGQGYQAENKEQWRYAITLEISSSEAQGVLAFSAICQFGFPSRHTSLQETRYIPYKSKHTMIHKCGTIHKLCDSPIQVILRFVLFAYNLALPFCLSIFDVWFHLLLLHLLLQPFCSAVIYRSHQAIYAALMQFLLTVTATGGKKLVRDC